MVGNTEEMCQNCIWWMGDNSGEQGECLEDAEVRNIRTGRYESCVKVMVRDIDTADNGEDLLDDYN